MFLCSTRPSSNSLSDSRQSSYFRSGFCIPRGISKLLLFSITAGFFISCAHLVCADTVVGGKLDQNTSWTREGGPYIVASDFSVPAGVTLDIKEGTVIKISKNALFDVRGMLVASGTPNEPVLFTSTESSPQVRDWNRPITFSQRAKGFFSQTIFEYGGGDYCAPGCVPQAMVSASRADLKIIDSTFKDTIEAIHADDAAYIDIQRTLFMDLAGALSLSGSVVSIKDSSFVRVDQGIRSMWPFFGPYIATENWWGSERGPKKFRENECGGASVNQNVMFSPWLSSRPTVGAGTSGDLTEIQLNSEGYPVPVIVIPGILGSMEWRGSWIIDPVLHVYDNLIDTLAANGYEKDSTLITFPYDWRKSNIETGKALKNLIDRVKSEQNCDRVDIVAHSMGGLVARSYLQSAEYTNDVRKIAFLGTPHKGAPADYLAWEAGDFPQTLAGRIMSILFRVYANIQGYTDGYSYVHGLPVASVQDLLPIYDYIRDVSDEVQETRLFPIGYPRNPLLESLGGYFLDTLSYLKSDNSQIFNFLGNKASSTMAVIYIGKNGTGTSNPLWEDGRPIGFENGPGDGTVPTESASIGDKDIVIDADHTSLPTEAAGLVVEKLTGKEPRVVVRHSAMKNLLTATINKIANLAIITPTGKRVGKSLDGEVAEVPGSFYSGAHTLPELISIPDPEEGEYRFEVFGKGNGDYSVEINKSSESDSSTISFSGAIAVDGFSASRFSFDEPLGSDMSELQIKNTSVTSRMFNRPKKRSGAAKNALETYIFMSTQPIEFADRYMKATLTTDSI